MLSDMSLLACLYAFDFFAFSETWLNSSVSDDSILIPGYSYTLESLVRSPLEYADVVWEGVLNLIVIC